MAAPPAWAQAKEPWQMTKEEYIARYGKPSKTSTFTGAAYYTPHWEAVSTEVNRGNKNIPANVLADYPDLRKRQP